MPKTEYQTLKNLNKKAFPLKTGTLKGCVQDMERGDTWREGGGEAVENTEGKVQAGRHPVEGKEQHCEGKGARFPQKERGMEEARAYSPGAGEGFQARLRSFTGRVGDVPCGVRHFCPCQKGLERRKSGVFGADALRPHTEAKTARTYFLQTVS